MRKLKLLVSVAGIFFLLFLTVASVRAQEYDVVPGRRIGLVEIGMNRQTVHGKLGKPSGTYRLHSRGRGDYWHSSDNSNTLRVFYNSAARVYQISVSSPRFTTSEGLNSRSSLPEIRRIHKNLKVVRVAARGDIDYYYDSRRGIAFEFTDRMEAHSSSMVMRPYAVLVFRPGTRPQPEADEFLR